MKKIINKALIGSVVIAGTAAFIINPIPKVNAKEMVSTEKKDNNNVSLTELYENITIPMRIITTTDEKSLKDIDIMKSNYLNYMCGNQLLNSNILVKGKIDSVNSSAKKALDSYIEVDEDWSKGIFKDVDLTDRESSDSFSTTAKNLQSMGIAYTTYGSTYYKNENVKRRVLDGLKRYYTFFNDDELLEKYFGNWYNWEIGIPTALSSLFLLMEDEINAEDPELILNYVKCMDQYLQNGKDGDVDLTARQHTGANLADITMNRVLQGIVTKDENRIRKAVSDMMTVYEVIDPNNIKNNNTDGVYEDGSFIQHHRVAYTGSYGVVLLQRISQSVIVLGGTQFQPEGHIDMMQKWIYESFTPVTFEGYMMEIVKGRATSRTGSGYADMSKIIDSMLQVIPYMDDEDANNFKEHIKYLVTSMPENMRPKSSSFSLISILPYEEIMNDNSIKAVSHSQKGHFAFNSMDKNVHVRDKFAFSISRSSNRIAKYEYMSGENKRSWFQGDGAFYLYQSGRNQTKSYGAEYYATVGPYRLPGTTVPVEERKTIQEWHNGKDYYDNPGLGFESGSEKQNDYVYFPVGTNHYSGSVELDGYSAAGMQLGDDIAYVDKQKKLLPEDFVVYKNANANKAWFMFDDEIVVMSSDIHDENGRQLVSTIDNRMSDENEKTSVNIGYTNGKKEILKSDGEYKNVSWINYGTNLEGTNVGYYYPETKDITIENGLRSGNLQDIRKQNPDKDVTHNLFTMTYNHGKNPKNESYSYVILPNADEKATQQYASNPQISILANDEFVQAVEHKGLNMKGYMFYGEAKVDGLKSNKCVSILMKEGEEETTLAISDPTFEESVIDLTLDMKNAEIVSGGENIIIEHQGSKTILHVNVENLNGKSLEVVLKEKDTTTLRDNLRTLIEESEKLHSEDYTETSWKNFSKALSNAKLVLENNDATVEELTNAIEELSAAKNKLEIIRKDEINEKDPDIPSKQPEKDKDKESETVVTGVIPNVFVYMAGLLISFMFMGFVLKKKKIMK